MPRQARLDAEGILHHVIIPRGAIPKVRSESTWKLVQEVGTPLAEIARQLRVSTSAISRIFRRRKLS